jgi:glutamate synthase (ferredoxin)
MLERQVKATQSAFAQRILADWDESLSKFVCVVPRDYQRMMRIFKEVESSGLSGEEAVMAAFELNRNDVSRIGGN